MKIINFIKSRLTSALIFTFATQVLRLLTGPIIILLIPIYLSPVEQGFWYTFTSIAALSIFADLGFSTIVTQFAAHEFAHLRLEDGKILGDEYYKRRLASLWKFVLRWVVIVSIVSFPIIFIIGWIFLSAKTEAINWLIPWAIFVFGSGISFVNSTLLCFFEGCNNIAKSQKIRILMLALSSLTVIISLVLKFKLYALAASMTISSIIGIAFLFFSFRTMVCDIYRADIDFSANWQKEILPLLGRYAISFASGYFIFQIYTPLAFQFYGPVAAGKVGITLSLCMSIFGLANVWIYVKNPMLNMLVSQKKWRELDILFVKLQVASTTTFVFGTVVVCSVLYFGHGKIKLLDRFMTVEGFSLLAIAWLLQLIVSTSAVYLRAHKQEPLVITSFVGACFTSVSSFFCAKYLNSAEYIFVGFLTSFVFIVPWIAVIFAKKRRVWHR